MRFSAVIFDFDGTLCDTGPGIMNSAAYALEAYGFEVPREPGALRCFIGPPLLVTFQERRRCGHSPSAGTKIQRALQRRHSQ